MVQGATNLGIRSAGGMMWAVLTAVRRFLRGDMDTPAGGLSIGSVTPPPALNVVSDGLPPQPRQKGLPDLTARALMYYSRDQAKAARYLRMHQLLSKGSCSDAQSRQG